jgi:microcompartment protein CcmK/EutM
MQLARVTGALVSTHKHPEFKGHKMLLVRALDMKMDLIGDESIALDTVGAGVGDRVLVSKEGGGARLALANQKIPVQALIVGIVDGVCCE